MCMKYVNANVQCFDSVTNNIFNLGRTGFSSILDSVKAKEKNGKYYIGDFNIVTFLNIRGTKGGDNLSNPVDAQKKLIFRVRLTKLDEDSEKQLSYDLKDFEVDLSKKVHQACFNYVERIEITNVGEICLDSKGAYVIKILVKEENATLFDVQITHPIYVN